MRANGKENGNYYSTIHVGNILGLSRDTGKGGYYLGFRVVSSKVQVVLSKVPPDLQPDCHPDKLFLADFVEAIGVALQDFRHLQGRPKN